MAGKCAKLGGGSVLATIVTMTSVILFTGCSPKEVRTIGSGLAPSQGQISKEELRRMLDKFEAFFTARLRQMSNNIYDRVPSKRMEKTTLLMRARMVQGLNAMLDQDDAVIAFIETWTMCERFRTYLEKGEGAELYGEGQEIAVATARQIENEIERIGRIFLKDDVFETAKKNIGEFANSNPMKGTFSNVEVFATSPRKGEPNPFVSIAKIPMTPFRAMEGVDRTASAIYRFTETADRATDVLGDMPESTRWQLRLLLYDLEETDMIKTFLTSATQFSESSSRLSKSVEDLPKQLRQELSAFIEEADDRQKNLRKTLEQTEETTVAIGNTLEKANKTADALGEVANDIAETTRAWESAAKATGNVVQVFREKKDPSATRQSFNINEYRAAAEQTSKAANDIEKLLASFESFAESRNYNTLINAITWRAIGFVSAVFAFALLYRVMYFLLVGKKFSTK